MEIILPLLDKPSRVAIQNQTKMEDLGDGPTIKKIRNSILEAVNGNCFDFISLL